MKQSLSLKRPGILAYTLAVSLISVVFLATSQTATAQTSVSQCNGMDNVGGQAVECRYVVTNNLDGATTSSTLTVTECHGAANDPPTMVCSTASTTSEDLVTTIDQCNGSGNGGGGTVTCSVDVINNITGTETPTSATVNQCNASGTGGGTEPTVLCDPFPATTTSATATQCNEAGNGGGGTTRVQCSVDSDSTTTAVLSVTINQCNGSGNGGGATVTCRSGLTNNVAPLVQPSPSPSPGGGGGGGGGGGDGSGDSSTGQVTQVPVGGAGAGGGSTSGIENAKLLLLGVILLAAAVPALVLRRQIRNDA